MGECGCQPSDTAILKVGDFEIYVDVYWEKCPSCDAPKSVQFSVDKYLIEAAKEFEAREIGLTSEHSEFLIAEEEEAS